MKRRGFTLVELLVIIVLIVIVTAIVFPIFIRALAKAQLATCTDNMGKIGRAVSLYALDNDYILPARPQNLAWMGKYESADPTSIFCPAASSSEDKGWGFNFGLKTMPKSGRADKAYLWDGKDLKQKFIPPSAGFWAPDWLAYRHRFRVNICFLDGHVKPYPQPDLTLQKTEIPASLF